MIGFRGASRYYDPRYRDGFALECRAVRKVRDEMGLKNLKLMIPFCRTVEEARRVQAEMAKHGLTPGGGTPDLTVTYYLLLSTTMSAQTMGQFLPSTVAWGLPPFDQATQSIKMMNRGSLVLDLSKGGTVVWRGLAQADIKFDADARKRESLLREAVRDLLAKYPVKKR